MPFEDGWAAINLEMPPRVPRTEYSADSHWALITAVTGIELSGESTPDEKLRARQAFLKAWNYDLRWATLIQRREFGEWATDMGHAAYQAGGVDKRPIGRQPFTSPEQVLDFDPWEKLGPRAHESLVERFNGKYRDNQRHWPDVVTMTGTYVTLVSGFIDLFGWDMLLHAAGLDPEGFGDLADRYASWMLQFMEALAEMDAPAVMIHDDMVITAGPIFHPDWYRRYVFPNYKRYVEPIRAAGKKVLFLCDGDYSLFIDDLVDCGFHGFVMEPMTDMKHIAEKYGKTHVFVGNADTRALLSGPRERIRAEVERCMAIGKSCPGFFMAVGNHIPPNTPVENCLYYNEVYEELSRR